MSAPAETPDLLEREHAARVAAERAIEQLRFALEAGGMGTWEFSIGSMAVKWSPGLEAIHGYAPGTFPGTFEAFRDEIHPEDRDRVLDAIREAIDRRLDIVIEYRIIRPDGAVRWVEGRGRIVLDDDGRPDLMMGVCVDITERKQDEARLLQLQQSERELRAEAERARGAAEAANRARADFLAMVSHDLRTPLNAIGGYAALLEEGVHGALGDRQIEALRRIRYNQRRASGLIDELLSFARLEAGQVRYRVEDLPLDNVLASIEPMIGPAISGKELTYRYLPCDPALTVRADRDKLEQVLLNLLTNAIKYTPPGGEITLDVDASAADVDIRVADNGRGIPNDALPGIFEPFVQGNDDTSGEIRGVGLGLSIGRQFARAMGGDLTVDSVPGRGSTFTIRLPAGPPANPS